MRPQHIFTYCLILLMAANTGCIHSQGAESDASFILFRSLTDQDKTEGSLDVPDFVYEIGHKFQRSVEKSIINAATSIADILPEYESKTIFAYHNIQVSTFMDERSMEKSASNSNGRLNDAQLDILHSLHYGSSFYITGNIERIGNADDMRYHDTLIYYLTVLPEEEAQYVPGEEVLIGYLKNNSKDVISVARRNKLQPGKISFTITRHGSVEKVKLDYSSGYPAIDSRMLKLIEDMPGTWRPAVDSKGIKVDQSLVFFFGTMGC